MLKVLMATSECSPFAKTGGLGDVLGALPKSLVGKDVDCRVMMPKYKVIPEEYVEKMQFKEYFYVRVGWRSQYCGIFELQDKGVTYYFIDNEYYFGTSTLYTWNDMEKFIFFQRAVLQSLKVIDFQPDVIHCHDWQTGLIPVLLDAEFKYDEYYSRIRTVMTIHNLQYQGIFSKNDANEMLGLPSYYFTPDKVEYYGDINFMKAGLVFANFITTVSNSYAEEIKQPYFGERLDGLLRSKSDKLGGILNGIDYEEYNPETDKYLDNKYNIRNFITGKRKNKTELQKELGLEVNKDIPMIGIVSRLVTQKGLDLITAVMDEILNLNVQVVVLGTGEQHFEKTFQHYAWCNHKKMSANIMFDNKLAHKIYAASDMFLMPSLFEPCGLGQIISLSYGTLPIVREVGGLKDTVKPYNEYTGEGNGFSFWAYNAHDMLYTIERAVELYKQPKVWNNIVRSAMKCDYSWEESAKNYINVYNHVLNMF